MGYHKIDENDLKRLHELADLQHPHMKGNNHTGMLINKVYNCEGLDIHEAFDCGKYYERMLSQLDLFKEDSNLHQEYLHAILDFKWCIK
jgi:hypothetical protein